MILCLISSCRVDEFSPCEKAEGMEGLLCKEFRFENDVSIGYLAFYYNTNRYLSRKEYKSTEGELKKYDLYEYADFKLSAERSFDAGGKPIRETIYTYNEQGMPAGINYMEGTVVIGARVFEYADTLVVKELNYTGTQLDNYITYQYYNGETSVYRTSEYSANHVLLRYTIFEYFVNDHVRHTHYTGTNVFNGYEVYDYNDNGMLTRFSVYNSSEQLTSYILYQYNNNGQMDASLEYDGNGKLLKNNKFIYNQ